MPAEQCTRILLSLRSKARSTKDDDDLLESAATSQTTLTDEVDDHVEVLANVLRWEIESVDSQVFKAILPCTGKVRRGIDDVCDAVLI